MQFFFHPRFSAADCGHVRMLIKGYVNQVRVDTPTDLRMLRVLAYTTNCADMTVTFTGTQRKAAIITHPTNLDKTPVRWKSSCTCSLNVFSCWASILKRATLLCGLRIIFRSLEQVVA
jgi:hypothetical protein